MQFWGQFERRKPAPAQLSLWQASFFFSLVTEFVDLVVYLHAKFGELNLRLSLRINLCYAKVISRALLEM